VNEGGGMSGINIRTWFGAEDLLTCIRDKHVSGSARLVIHSRISGGSAEKLAAI
jgi:hypothetical protein